jgi:GntR family transcriptional regulator, rspAB operon transcriptional repressor
MELKTKEEQAYDDLKLLILAGELPKNEFLSQRMLAQRVTTNITTIRTALRQLERDGLMENVPQWGVRIPGETEERLRDLYFVRELLETGAVRRLVERREVIDARLLREKARICDARASELPASVIAFSQVHFDFHMELARQSGSELLVQSLNRVHFRSWLLWHDVRLWQRRFHINHVKLIDVILTAPEKEAVAAMQKHIIGGLKMELDEIRKARPGPVRVPA